MTRFILPIILAYVGCCLAELEVAYEWKYIDYLWDSDDVKAEYTENGWYNYKTIIPNDVQSLSDGRVLITTPRNYANNPSSLATISDKTGDGGNLLAPYPDWSWHTKTDCSGITSVVTVSLDDYDRLWMVDSGKIVNEQVCPAKLMIFNATTDELLETVPIPDELSHSPTDKSKGYMEISLVIADSEIEKSFVIMSDPAGYGIVIWNGTAMWRRDDAVFTPEPTQTTFEINGVNMTLDNDGPNGQMILLRSEWVKEPTVLFKSLAGNHARAMTLKDAKNSYSSTPTFYQSVFKEPSQETVRLFTKKHEIFFGGFAGSMFGCWDSNTILEVANIGTLSTDTTTLQYVSSIKSEYCSSTDSEKLYVMSNRLQRFILNVMDFDEINFRIMTADVGALIEGTVCVPGTVTQVDSIEDKKFYVWSESS